MNPFDFSTAELDKLFDLASDIEKNPAKYSKVCDSKILATCFYEPSTRTRLSFESAMTRLGGTAIGFSDAGSSSASKGESVADTIRVISSYADICAMRHHKEGAPMVAAANSRIPVINAGDGGHQHPTQTLTDLLTIRSLHGKLDHFTIGMCGDLKFGRTVHSLVNALSRYENVRFVFISPAELKMPDYLTHMLASMNIPYEEVTSLDDALPALDVLYMTRVQRERFASEEEYLRLKDVYILTPEKMLLAKENMLVLHPLPRVNEISVEVDKDPRAAYFKQAQYGVYVRMALIMTLLGLSDTGIELSDISEEASHPMELCEQFLCKNPRCITTIEQELPHIFYKSGEGSDTYRCKYCEEKYEA
jgi:aspartate carbamoyltransferase catalytic subunit